MHTDASTIEDAARQLGVSVTEQAARAISTHLTMVIETNETMNLTSIDPQDAVTLHVLDSLTALSALDAAPEGPFADLGSGAGYPGVPLCVVSGRQVALVESVRKKAAFLERVTEVLRLKATVHPIRAEELAKEMPAAFAAVTARALSSLPSLVELAAPLLSSNGLLICMKARVSDDELERGDRAAKQCGMRRTSISPVELPGSDVQRTIVVFTKVGTPRARIPRRPGMAQRQPLA